MIVASLVLASLRGHCMLAFAVIGGVFVIVVVVSTLYRLVDLESLLERSIPAFPPPPYFAPRSPKS